MQVCRRLKTYAVGGSKVKVYTYVMPREENRGYDVVKNTVVEETEEKYLEKYSDRLQLSVEYPRTNKSELKIKDD